MQVVKSPDEPSDRGMPVGWVRDAVDMNSRWTWEWFGDMVRYEPMVTLNRFNLDHQPNIIVGGHNAHWSAGALVENSTMKDKWYCMDQDKAFDREYPADGKILEEHPDEEKLAEVLVSDIEEWMDWIDRHLEARRIDTTFGIKNVTVSERLLNEIGPVSSLVDASEADLRSVQGMGDARVERVMQRRV